MVFSNMVLVLFKLQVYLKQSLIENNIYKRTLICQDNRLNSKISLKQYCHWCNYPKSPKLSSTEVKIFGAVNP